MQEAVLRFCIDSQDISEDHIRSTSKALESASIKLARVFTNIEGVSGRAMVDGIIARLASLEAVANQTRGTGTGLRVARSGASSHYSQEELA